MLVFEERGKMEYPGKNRAEQSREPTTNSTHMMPGPEIKPRTHWWEVSTLTAAQWAIKLAFISRLYNRKWQRDFPLHSASNLP